MGRLDGFFVRKVTDDAISAVRTICPSAEILTNSEFVAAILNRDARCSEQDLMQLSAHLATDVMWLRYHNGVGWFEYHHWRAGILLRAVVRGAHEDRIWERAEGLPEAWERQLFFDPNDLAELFEEDAEEEEECRYSDEKKQELEQFWQTSELMVGRMEPFISEQGCINYIATYYRFPGWENESLP